MHTDFTTHQDELMASFEELEKTLSDGDKKYLHLKSVHNFIAHLSDIANTDDKTWIYSSLKTYLKECPNLTIALDRNKSDEAYKHYVDKLGDYYSSRLNFSMIANNRALQALYLLFVVAMYFFVGIWIALSFLLLFVVRTQFIYKKKRQNKVYGLYY